MGWWEITDDTYLTSEKLLKYLFSVGISITSRKQQWGSDGGIESLEAVCPPVTPYRPPPEPDGFLTEVSNALNEDMATSYDEGGFYAVREVLFKLEEETEFSDPTMEVAYAYSYRLAMAGLFFQGIESSENYWQAKVAHEFIANAIGTDSRQVAEGNAQGRHFVWCFTRNENATPDILDRFYLNAEQGVDVYKLSAMLNRAVTRVKTKGDKVSYLPVKSCVNFIKLDLYKKERRRLGFDD